MKKGINNKYTKKNNKKVVVPMPRKRLKKKVIGTARFVCYGCGESGGFFDTGDDF